MKDVIKKLLKESIAEHIIETPMDEDYPSTWNIEQFKQFRKFSERIRYCDEHLQKIASGTGRVVYKVDDKMVLKLAKNPKGIAQNEIEMSLGTTSYFSHIVGQVIDAHDDAYWVEMELARKVSKGTFKKMVGVDIREFEMYLRNFDLESKGKSRLFYQDEKIKNFLDENEFTQDVCHFINDTDSMAGDMGRVSTWGLVARPEGDTLVLIDYGLTDAVYKTHYARKERPQRMAYYQ